MTGTGLPSAVVWPIDWGSVPLWALFDRIKDVGHPDETMLSVYRDYGVIVKDSRTDNANQTAEDRDIYQLIDAGWLVINRMKAWQGSVGISRHRGVVSGHYLCFRPKHREDSRYLNWLLRSDVYTSEYLSMSRGVRPGQVEIDNDDLRSLRVAIPPVDEQRRISEFLDREIASLDSLVSARRNQLVSLSERYGTQISEAVAPGVTSRGPLNAKWPWLPDSVDTVRLGYLARVQSGITVHEGRAPTSTDAEYPYLRVANVQGEWIDAREIRSIKVPREVAQRSMLAPGDVLMTEANGNPDNLGRGAVWDGHIPNIVHQNHVFALRVDRRRLLPEFLSLVLASVHGRRYFRFTSTQVGIATTSSSKVLGMPIPVASIRDQAAVVAECLEARHAADQTRSVLERQLSVLSERRRAVITAAVTGQIDLSTARGATV